MTHLQISLLGPIQVVAADQPVTAITSPKILALLAYLSAEAARVHSREALAELLWSGQTTGRQNLRQSLSRLISALPQPEGEIPFFLATRQEIGFNAASDHVLDLAQFTQALESVRRHPHPATQPCSTCVQALTAAVALYRGDFVDGLLAESPPFEEWALLKREWLRQEALWALDALARHHAEQHDHAQAYRYARRQIEIDPLREDGYRQAMLALAQEGQRAAALAQYEILAERLREDLGVAPSAESAALYDQIGAAPRAADRNGRMSPSLSFPAHNLPPQFTPFVGRTEDRRQIHERLDRAECRLLTLVAPGGMGKTRLAIQAAQERLDHHPDGVWFVSLAESTSAVGVIEAIAAAADIRFSAKAVTMEKLRAELLRDLRPLHLLLVLDNFEHLLSAPDSDAILDLVLDLIGQTAHVDLIITSRQPLHLRAEWIVDVAGLPAPPLSPALTDPASLAEYESVQFLVQAFGRLRPEFRLTSSSAAAVQQICALVGGAPLALELAAATIRTRTPAQIAQAIRQSLDALDTSMRDMPPRHRSLRAVFEDAQRTLPPAAQIYFRRLSIFPASFSAQAAAEIADVRMDGLTLLRQHALLRQERANETEARFSFHEMLRQFAAEQLSVDPADAHRIHVRHCHYYTTILAEQQTVVENGDSPESTALIHAEMDNIRAAWSWAVTHADVDALARGTHPLLRHYVGAHLAEEGARAFGDAAAAVQAHLDADPDPHPVQVAVLADLYAALARMLFKLARYKEAEAVVGRAIDLAESASAGRPAALAHLYCGLIHLYQAQNADAQRHFETALRLARSAAWPKIESDALRGLGILYDGRQDWTRAEHYYAASLEISRQINDLRGASASLGNLGVIRQHRGDYGGARACLEQALAVYEAIGDGSSVGRCLTSLGSLVRDQGDRVAAEEFLTRACRILSEIRDRHHEADALLELGRFHQQQDQPEQAIPCLERALALYREVEDRAGEAEAAEELSMISQRH